MISEKNNDWGGNRRKNIRRPLLENILILTDGKCTEVNYFKGLKSTLPLDIARKIRIKVIGSIATKDLITKAIYYRAHEAQNCEIWLILDRDMVPKFNNLVDNAEKDDFKVGWSNPCIEVWFKFYFCKSSKIFATPQECINDFSSIFLSRVNKKYRKNDKKIYNILNDNGNQKEAIEFACKAHNHQKKNFNGKINCEKASTCTTVYLLVKKIMNCINKE